MTKKKKNYEPSVDKNQIQALVKLAASAKFEFDKEPLVAFIKSQWKIIKAGLKPLAELLRKSSPSYNATVIEKLFGKFSKNHSFNAQTLDWKYSLRERDVTETLAHLLNMGEPSLCARRMHAFLKALQIKNIPTLDVLEMVEVFAEKDQIDIEIRWPVNQLKNQEHKYRSVVIEAKLDAQISENQLSKYYKSRKDCCHDWILLTLNKITGRKGRQNTLWRFVFWRDLWLRFEKLRPEEENPNMTIFLKTLWSRIGGLNA